MQDRTN